MKLNLEYGNQWLNGYVNISMWPPQEIPKDLPEATQIIVGQVGNLDNCVDDNSAEEVIFNPLLNSIKPNDLLDILSHWYRKLKDKGILKISFVDVRLLARYIYNGEMNLQDVHNTVMGPNKQYESVLDLEIIKGVLLSGGFKIDSITHKQYLVNIEAFK